MQPVRIWLRPELPDATVTRPRHYRALSPLKVWRHGRHHEQVFLGALWLLMLGTSVGLGLATVIWRWSGLPLNFGGVVVYITIYPPLLICLLLTLTCGWWWGAVPAYLATFTLGVYSGMPLPWAALFACANPLGFGIMTIAYQAIAIRRDLRSLSSLLFYLQMSFIASIFSSSGALVWCYSNRIDATAVLPIWQGWWLGAFLQSVLIVGPLMAVLWPRLEQWQSQRPELLYETATDTRQSVLRVLGLASAGVLFYGFVTLQLTHRQVNAAASSSQEAFRQAVSVMQQTTWVFYAVFSVMIVFIALFGYRLFVHWKTATDRLLAELHLANLNLEVLAQTDGLTGLLNRRAVEEQLSAEWQRERRLGGGAALVMLDIDHFKRINDRYGHPVGDAVIRSLAAIIQAVVRDIDITGRFGGEEFLIVLPQADAHGAWTFAERLRERVLAQAVSHEAEEIHFSISLGIAVPDASDSRYENWLARADQALYQAKHGGRNQTAVAGSQFAKPQYGP